MSADNDKQTEEPTDDAVVDAVDTEEAGEAPDDGEQPDELEQARAEAAQNHDRYLRAAAELDNYRKRTVKIRAETRDETLRDVLLQVGPMLDNFRRALEQESEDVASYRQGIEIIYRQFTDILSGYGLVEIEAEGQPFDPNLHEALAQVPTDEHEPGTVMQEMEKGYMLNDRVVRPARVVVAAQKAASGDGETGDESSQD
jgi:molecular chaperone GrpE